MRTAIWTGSLSFGLVVVPVRLYPAIRKKTVRFHELDPSGRRVRHVRVPLSETEFVSSTSHADLFPAGISSLPRIPRATTPIEASPEIPFEEIRKGYEVAPGQYVSLTREEVQALAPERSRAIDVEQFVDVAAVDPIYFESRYYVTPDRGSAKPFQLLGRAMSDAGRMAIAWITLRQRRYLSAIRPYGRVMLLSTMVHADEVLAADFWAPEKDAAPADRELKMARLLIDTLAGPFAPERYTDEHRGRVLRAIEEKAPTAAAAASPPSPTRVLDLMAALEASVKAARAAKAERDQQPKVTRRRSRGA